MATITQTDTTLPWQPACYAVNPADERQVILVRRLSVGYWPQATFPTAADAKAFVDRRNALLGYSPEVAESFALASCFGWDCPAAAPALAWKRED